MRWIVVTALCGCAAMSNGRRDGASPEPDAGPMLTGLDITSSEAGPLDFEIGTIATRSYRAVVRGSGLDVTQSAEWSVSGGGASATDGELRASMPGHLVITATYRDVGGSMPVDVRAIGETVIEGAPDGASTALGATVTESARPTIAYPLERALFPGNLAAIEIQVEKTVAAQSWIRISFTSAYADLRIVGVCTNITRMGCGLTLPASSMPALVAASAAGPLQMRVRLAQSDGSALVESEPREIAFSSVYLEGALYYWSTRGTAAPTGIYRINLDAAGTPPEGYFLQSRHSPVVGGSSLCVGCHSLSRDGRRLALAFGGSDPGHFALYDVATRTPIATRMGPSPSSGPQYFAAMSALSPDASHIVTVQSGIMTLRHADETLSAIGGPLFTTGLTTGDRATEPYWSADGSLLAFTGWNPDMYECSSCSATAPKDNGDLTPYSQIYIASIGPDGAGEPRLLVPRSGREHSSYYPAISDDNRWVVFNRVSCSAPGNNDQYPIDRTGAAAACSGYDNPGARVMVVPASGGEPIDLARLNGEATYTSSWPRFAPGHGSFRGQPLYWIAFSSKRAYGLRLPGDATGSNPDVHPQLWFAAFTPGATEPVFAPIWLPLQNPADSPAGNHVPQWVSVFVDGPI